MKRKNMKQVLATILSAAMVMGMSMAAMAAEGDSSDSSTPSTVADNTAEVEAPIYSFDKTVVVVPTSLVVAFNPDELTVKTDATTGTSTAQVLSKNFGILNKSSKDKIVTVTLQVEDLNDDKITFVDTAAKATGAAEGAYAVYLAAEPADTTEVKVGSASADKDTAAAAIADVTMTAATANAVTLAEGNNTMAFVLQKGTYAPVSGSEITLGSTNTNVVTDNLELTAVAGSGKGITAFTFTGALNKKADWSKLSSGIKITAVYDFETTYEYDALTDTNDGSIASGTGALLSEMAPKFKAGNIGVINYTEGIGDSGLKSITSITLMSGEAPFDGYNALSGAWEGANDEAGVITFDNNYISAFAKDFPDDDTKEATITYVTNGDETKTVTVDLKLR